MANAQSRKRAPGAINVPHKAPGVTPPLPALVELGAAAHLTPVRARWVASAFASAAGTLGELARGGRVSGVTKGQFGLTELIGAVLGQTGPADVVVWTWSIHHDDARLFAGMRARGLITRFTTLIDRSFPARQPLRCAPLVEALGSDNIYCTNNHAKVVLVSTADGWRVVIQSSMNCNRNFRFEHFDVTDDPAIWGHWNDLTRHITERTTPGVELVGPQEHDAFKSALGGGVAREVESVDPADVDLDALLADVDLDVPDV